MPFAILEKLFTPVLRMAKTVVSARLEVSCKASSSFFALGCFHHTFWVPDCGNVATFGATSVPLSDCGTRCVGDHSEMCGGSDRLNLY